MGGEYGFVTKAETSDILIFMGSPVFQAGDQSVDPRPRQCGKSAFQVKASFEFADSQSTILYRITMGTVVASAPTVGSNHEVSTKRHL